MAGKHGEEEGEENSEMSEPKEEKAPIIAFIWVLVLIIGVAAHASLGVIRGCPSATVIGRYPHAAY